MRRRDRRVGSIANGWAACRRITSMTHARRWVPKPIAYDEPDTSEPDTPEIGSKDLLLHPCKDLLLHPCVEHDVDDMQMTEENFRTIEAAFLLDRGSSHEGSDRPAVGGLAWVMYRVLAGDPQWNAAATIEALRAAIKNLYRNRVFP